MVLLRLLAIFLLIYFGLRFIGRLIFPPVDNRNRHFERSRHEKTSREGDVTIEDKPSSDSKKIKKDEGEYIDYEEVDE